MTFVPMKTIDTNWENLKNETGKSEAPIEIDQAYNQRLTIFHNPLNPKGMGQFTFDIGKKQNRINVKLNIAWGNVGPGGTYTLNRLAEELAAYLRKQDNIQILKATAYLPETQDFQPWCQFIEVRQGIHNPIMCYVIWNGKIVIPSIANMTQRDNARDWTFTWKNALTIEQTLKTLEGEME